MTPVCQQWGGYFTAAHIIRIQIEYNAIHDIKLISNERSTN
jgi:hypothetical protein